MTIKLIYHNSNSVSGGVSPFDEAINEITRGEDILLACPYLSVSYLKYLIARCKTWRVLTDVEEWIASHSPNTRQEIQDFIHKHSEHIHHYKDLHAKVIVSGEHAFVGSANFTEKGLTRRVEVSVLFEQEEQVEELRRWFDSIWLQTSPVDVDEMEEYVNSLPISQIEMPRSVITSKAPKVKARLVSSSKVKLHISEATENARQRLMEHVRLAPDREWIDGYFDLVKELLVFTGLKNDDPRLVLSIPKDKILPVTINRRYVLAASFSGIPVTGFIFGEQFRRIPELKSKKARPGRFRPFSGESEEETPYFIWLEKRPSVILSEEMTNELEDEWRDAVLFEVNHGKTSSFRKFHEPVFYEVAVNLKYRARVLEEAFP
jgi:phospholipase D-like protein